MTQLMEQFFVTCAFLLLNHLEMFSCILWLSNHMIFLVQLWFSCDFSRANCTRPMACAILLVWKFTCAYLFETALEIMWLPIQSLERVQKQALACICYICRLSAQNTKHFQITQSPILRWRYACILALYHLCSPDINCALLSGIIPGNVQGDAAVTELVNMAGSTRRCRGICRIKLT